MRFTEFLIESHVQKKQLNEKHDLVLQKVLDAVDNGHVDYSDSEIIFDIGDISDTPKLRGLKLVIRASQNDSIQLGKDDDGTYAIVVDTSAGMPGRQDIDTFLASKKIYQGFKKAYRKYVEKYHDHDKEYEPNDTERKIQANDRGNFESSYYDLMDAVNAHHKKYSDATGEIDKELGRIANVGRKTALDMAKQNLRDEYLGKSDKDFISKVMQFPEAEFTKHLDKEWKSKLEGRLSNFYNSNYRK